MISYSDAEKRKIIMDNYLNPKWKKPQIIETDKTLYIHSSSCVDEIKINISEDKQKIEYSAQGCAIFLASVEIFIARLNQIGWDKKKTLIENFKDLVNQYKLKEIDKELLGELNVFANVKKHLNRIECALLITKLFDQNK